MRAWGTRMVVVLIAALLLGSGDPEKQADGTTSGAVNGPATGNPTLFEVWQQCNEIAAFFPVDLALARQQVPRAFKLAVDDQGKAGGALILMHCPDYFWLTTPNSPPLQRGENTAPGSVVHLWFMLEGAAQVLPVPGAQVTAPTQYAYAVADLVTSPVAARVYGRAGKNAVLISGATLVGEGGRQTGEILFANGSKITLDANTRTQLPTPLRVGGNIWTWHIAGPAEKGDDPAVPLHPDVAEPSDVNTTRVIFLALAPGAPNTSHVTIHAEPSTPFVDYFGAGNVMASRATYFSPNNVVNNSSRGELAWTTYPPHPLPYPPLPPM
jgi:hypothetical protein